jgi:hypothetical protein
MNTDTLMETAVATGQTLTSTELERACLYLRQTTNYVIGATKGLSAAQWAFKPDPGRWSIAEIVEHIVTVQELVLGPIREQLAAAPPPVDHDYKQVDEIVVYRIPVRLDKFPSPPAAQPAGRLTQDAAAGRLSATHPPVAAIHESTPDHRQHVLPSAPIKAITKGVFQYTDGYQWILAAAAHTERHAKQILEVRADDGFPPE